MYSKGIGCIQWDDFVNIFCKIPQLLVSQLWKKLDRAPAFYYFSVLGYKLNVPGTQEWNIIQERFVHSALKFLAFQHWCLGLLKKNNHLETNKSHFPPFLEFLHSIKEFVFHLFYLLILEVIKVRENQGRERSGWYFPGDEFWVC